ncbi:MAG: hypothetical protein LBV72_13815 [Tannerella sp.]|jgi:hypothetical protein|nr:hypothetical protein [Tannerella sp.]
MEQELKKASERWIREGKIFKDEINAWLDIIYIDGEDTDTECPEETRKDMAGYVLEQLVKFNEEGKHKEFRELFPPDNDPLGNDVLNNGSWYSIRKVAMLSDGRVLAKLGNYHEWQGVYVMNGDEITEAEGLLGFGFSKDKKYFAKVYNDRIDVHEGWDGLVVSTFGFPEGSNAREIEFDSVEVLSDGKRIVLVSHRGIFIIDEKSCTMIHGSLEGEEKPQEFWHTASADDEPERPAHIPSEAVWCGDGEWAWGKNNADGNSVGEWKWWTAPTGHLVCDTTYEGDSGNDFTFTRYHEDGTLSETGRYIGGQLFGDLTYYRSDNPTTEDYPAKAGPDVYRTVIANKNGCKAEEHYYDKQGNECQEPYISNVEMSELLKKMSVIDRFYIEKDWKHLLEAADELIESGEAEDDDMDQMKVTYYKTYASYQLAGKENITDLEEDADTILDLYSFTLWPFLSEFNIARSALRFAYYIKAQLAISGDDWEEARDQLREAFNVTSPIDNEDMSPYEALKNHIIEKLGSFDDDGGHKYKFLDYPHAAVSPDDKYIAVGSQSSSHIVLKEQEGEWVETANIVPRSEYPNIACFNDRTRVPILGLGSCHFQQSGTLGVYVEQIEGLEASGWEMDSEAIWVIDDSKWIFSMYPSGQGFYLGANDGYIWRKMVYNEADYLYIGGTIMSIDISPDNSYLIAGTHSGQVVVLRWDEREQEEGKNPRVDPYLITNLPVIDEKRYVFMAGHDPMVW